MTGIMHIERLVPYPPRKLWAKLIQNAEATDQGVVLHVALPGDVAALDCTVARYESPRLLECRRDGNVLRWELAPYGEGMTLLAFTLDAVTPT
jgi:hypothetical protein